MRFVANTCPVLAAIVLLWTPCPAVASTRTVALSSDHPPGTPAGVRYRDLSTPVLNNEGFVAFHSRLEGSGVGAGNNEGVWSESSGVLSLVGREGSQVGGLPEGTQFSWLSALVLNASNQLSFQSGLIGNDVTSMNNSAVWLEQAGQLNLVSRSGDSAPGLPADVDFRGFSWQMFNDDGETTFRGWLQGDQVNPNNDSGIWAGELDRLALLARTGDEPPGIPVQASFLDFSVPVLNDAGHVAFRAQLESSDVGSDPFNTGVFSSSSGTLGLIARTGETPPGFVGGEVFDYLQEPSINNLGQTAFWASINGDSVTGFTDEGIWSETSGSLALVARDGDPAPGASIGTTFGPFSPYSVLINDIGQTTFTAATLGEDLRPNGSGIWVERDGTLVAVAISGDSIPEGSGGSSFLNFRHSALNQVGQVVFMSTLVEGGVTSGNGIFGTDRDGGLQLIARTGDTLEVAPGVLKTIAALDFANFYRPAGNSDGRPSGFNDFGQLAFWAEFSDGTDGIFVSHRIAVPEPGLSFFLLAIFCGRRKTFTL